MEKDYYGVLGIPKNATKEQVKEAYRKAVLKYHPDVNKDPSAEEKMRDLNEAYAVLGDDQKRTQYDTYGSTTFHQRFSEEDIFRGFDLNQIFREMGINSGFGFDTDMFGGFFNQQPNKELGQSILYKIDLTLEEVAKGTNKEVTIKHVRECDRCKGSGGEPGAKLSKCDHCNGSGYTNVTRSTMLGRINTITTCTHCGGRGKLYEKRCRSCGGNGGAVKSENVSVTIPAGMESGMRLRLARMGDYGKDGSGDLFIEVNELNHKVFTRSGDNILANVQIPFYTAMLGGEITVPTLGGSRKVAIEPGTPQGKQITLKNEGIRRLRGSGAGDEIITVNITIPKSLSHEETELVDKFRALHEGQDQKKKFGIF